VLGYSNNGLEMWAYPVQILKAYRVSFRPAETTTEIDGPAILRRITYSPESITRTYLGSDFIVREKLFVPLDEPGAIISYDVESNRPLNIVVRGQPRSVARKSIGTPRHPRMFFRNPLTDLLQPSALRISSPTMRPQIALDAHRESQPSHSHCGQAASRTMDPPK
jgi:glycogen debranching enzyme